MPVYASAQHTSSASLLALGMKLTEYYDAMKHEPLDVQENECDFLIETASDSTVRQFVALDIYRHYRESDLMGAENVAVHVFDKWFASGLVKMPDVSEYQQAQVYADFNRSSLIGRPAQEMMLENPDGGKVALYADDAATRFSVLYFYDTDCAKCKLETIFLNGLFSSKNYPVDVYAVYAGDNQEAWQKYMSENLTNATHLWNPALSSDFQRKYGVTQTPRLFLISPEGIILGRGLDTDALEVMLNQIFAVEEMVYGSKEAEELFDGIFAMYDGTPGVSQVKGIADYIADKTLPASDTLMFKQLSGDYLYYLSTHSGEGLKEGLRYHIEKNIYSQPSVWKSQDDSLKVLGFAGMMHELLSKAEVGTKVPAMKVPGQLHTWRKSKNVSKRLDKLSANQNIIIFYTQGCNICIAEKEAAFAMLSKASDSSLSKDEQKAARSTNVFMINMDALMEDNAALATRLMETFDLSSLPYIIMTDSKGTVLRRYMTLQ